MSSTYETNPPRSQLERHLIRLSIKSARIGNEGAGGTPEYVGAESAALLAGITDPLGRELVGVCLDDGQAFNAAFAVLERPGWNRWHDACPRTSISPEQHGKLTDAALREYKDGAGWKISDLRKRLGVSGDSWRRICPHYLWLGREIKQASHTVTAHLLRQERRFEID
jgi:hypothetical protein